MERRTFLKTSCNGCAALAAFGVAGLFLESCSTPAGIFKAESSNGQLRIPLDKFSAASTLVVRNNELPYDLLVVKKSESEFLSLALQCTHRQQPLVVTSGGLVCNEHGSRFDFDGNVTMDPATRPLSRLRTELRENEVIVHTR